MVARLRRSWPRRATVVIGSLVVVAVGGSVGATLGWRTRRVTLDIATSSPGAKIHFGGRLYDQQLHWSGRPRAGRRRIVVSAPGHRPRVLRIPGDRSGRWVVHLDREGAPLAREARRPAPAAEPPRSVAAADGRNTTATKRATSADRTAKGTTGGERKAGRRAKRRRRKAHRTGRRPHRRRTRPRPHRHRTPDGLFGDPYAAGKRTGGAR